MWPARSVIRSRSSRDGSRPVGKYSKAILAFLLGALGTATGLDITDGFPPGEILTSLATGVIAGLAAWGVPNKGYVDLSGLTPEQREQVNQFLNLR